MPTGTFGSPDSLDRQASTALTGASRGSPSQSRGTGADAFGGASQAGGSWASNQYAGTSPQGAWSGAGAAGSARSQFPMLYGINSQGQVGSPPPAPNYSTAGGLAGVQSLVDTMYGPQSQLLADQLARQQAAMGTIGTETAYSSDALKRDNALANQALGLDKQALGLERGLAQGQLGNLGRLRGILDQQRGLVGERRGLDTDQAKDQASRQQWDLRSDLTARGAFNTVANERGTGRINRDLDYNLRGIDQTYRNNLLGLTEKGISYDNQAAALNNKLANVGLDAKRLDLSGQQLNNALADGLHNIGLQGQTSINSLLDAMTGTNAQQAQLATTILQQVIGYSNLPPDVIAQLNAAMGTGPGAGQSSGPGARLPGSRVPL